MSCKKINPFGEPSLLFDELYKISNNNESIATEWYSHFVTNEFLDNFGNYLGINETNVEEFENRINDQNEPQLFFNEKLNKHYYLDKVNEPVFYPEKQGLTNYLGNNDIKTFAKTIGLKYYEENFTFNNNSFTFDRTNNTSLRDFIKPFLNNKVEELTTSENFEQLVTGMSLSDTKDLINEWYNETINFFHSLNINTELIDVDEQEQQDAQEDYIRGEIVRVESFLKSSKANVSNDIKLFLSLIPSNNLNKFNEYDYTDFNKLYNILNNNLSDLVPIDTETGIEDEFELFKDTIDKLANREPSLNKLSEKINNVDEEFKNKFVNTFRLGRNNFLTSQFTTEKDRLHHIVMNISDVSSLQANILEQWSGNNTLLKLKESDIKSIKSELLNLQNNLIKDSKNIKSEADLVKYIKSYQEISSKFGLQFSTEGFDYYLDNLNPEPTVIENRIQTLIRTIKDSNYGLKEGSNIFKDQGIFTTLAKAEAFFQEEQSDASVFSVGGNKWVYSLPSYLKLKINQWKKDPSLLARHYDSTPYTRGSHWMKYLLALDVTDDIREEESKKRLNQVELGIFNNLQEEGDSSNSVDNNSLAYVDSLSDYMNKLLAFKKGSKVYHKTALAADKSTEYQFHFGNNADYFAISANAIYADNKVQVSDAVLEIFYNYFKSEYDRMTYEHQYLEQNKELPENLKPNYHLGNKNAFKSQLFPSLSINYTKDGIRQPKIGFDLYDTNGVPLYDNLDQIKDLVKEEISNHINNGIFNTYNTLFDNQIFEFNEDGVKINRGLDNTIYNKYVEESSVDRAPLRIAADMFVNSVVSQVEYSKIFTGDTAYYKDMVDYKKRVPETYTDGQYMRLKPGEEYFNIAVVASIEIPVPYMNKLTELVGNTIAEKYTEVNATDAQAWITPNRWKFILQRIGKWDNVRQSAFDKMMNEQAPVFTKKELKALGQPLKGVYFDNKQGTPIYLKYSQAVLWPNLIRGTQLEDVYNKMKGKVDELITKDGIKVGYNTPTRINDDEGNLLKDFNLNPVQLANYAWKLQQDLPVKGFKSTDVGSQIQKNIFQGLVFNLDKEFDIDGETKSGDQMIDYINNIQSRLSDIGYNRVIKKLGVNPDTLQIENEDELYNSIIEQLRKRRDVPANFIKALEAKISPYGIPGSQEMFQNVFSSFVNDNVIKIKTNGGGFIQMSDFGLSKSEAESKGILFTPWFNTDKLSTPQFYTNPETNKRTIIPGGIFISGTLISKYIPDYRSKTSTQLFGTLNESTGKYENGLIDQDILTNIIGYRIPNQSLASNDALTVMGLLPDESGDSIVLYTGITTKTGSDFDVDKTYVMVPSFKPMYKKSTYNSAKEYIKSNEITISEMRDELSAVGYANVEKLSYKDVENYFIEDLLLNGEPDESEFSREFQEQYSNQIVRLQYSQPNEDQTIDNYSEDVLKNKLIESYKSVLTNPNVIQSVMNPIDIPYIADDIKNLFPDEKRADMLDFDAISDLNLKFEFSQGKAGLGQNVNQLVDGVRGSMGDLYFTGFQLEQGNYNGETVLVDQEYSKSLTEVEINAYVKSYNSRSSKKITKEDVESLKQVKVFDSMTAYINGFVDIAKDPYVVRGNWLTQTNNVGFLMLRSGVHPFFVNAFLGQPILKDYIKFISNSESKVINDTNRLDIKFKTKALRDSVDGTWTTNGNTISSNKLLQTVTSYDKKGNYSNMTNNLRKEDYLDYKNKWMNDLPVILGKQFKLNPKQSKEDQMIVELSNFIINSYNQIFENPSDIRFEDLTLTDLREQFDNPNVQIQSIILSKFQDLIQTSKLLNKSVNASKVDVNGKGKNITSLLITKNLYNSLLNPDEDVAQRLVGFESKLFRNNQNTFGQTYKENSIDKIYDIMRNNPKFFLAASDASYSTFNIISDFIYGENLQNQALADKLERAYYSYIMSGFEPFKLSNENKQSLLTQLPNQFKDLKATSDNILLKKLYLKEGINGTQYIAMTNNRMSSSEKNDLTDAWNDLFITEPQFAESLVKYSFLVSGFNNTFTQFHQFIPYEWFNKNRFNSYLKSLNLNNQEYDEVFMDQFFQHNTDDYSVVKTIYDSEVRFYPNDYGKSVLISNTNDRGNYIVRRKTTDQFTKSESYKYYKLSGYNQAGQAIYIRVQPLGGKDKQGNKIVEYNMYNQSNSILERNKVDIDQSIIDKVLDEVVYSNTVNITDDNIVKEDLNIENMEEWSQYGITEQEWLSLTEDEQNKIKECN